MTISCRLLIAAVASNSLRLANALVVGQTPAEWQPIDAETDSGGVGDAELTFLNETADKLENDTLSELADDGAGEVPLAVESHTQRLFVGIMTSPEAFDRRAEVRSSWLRALLEKHDDVVDVKFFIGQPSMKVTNMTALNEEIKTYNDIIQLPVAEAQLQSQSQKTMFFFRWALHYRGYAEFLFKLEDDSFPRFDRILPMVEHAEKKTRRFSKRHPNQNHCFIVMGTVQECQIPSKSRMEQISAKYPVGSGYIVSRDLARALSITHYSKNRKQMLANEDMSLGVWIHQNKATLPNLQWMSMDTNVEGCDASDTVSTGIGEGTISCMWRNHLMGKDNICCEGKPLAVVPKEYKVNRYLRRLPGEIGDATFCDAQN